MSDYDDGTPALPLLVVLGCLILLSIGFWGGLTQGKADLIACGCAHFDAQTGEFVREVPNE